jgi:hypothetical protein
MFRLKMPKLIVVTALAVAALAATPLYRLPAWPERRRLAARPERRRLPAWPERRRLAAWPERRRRAARPDADSIIAIL